MDVSKMKVTELKAELEVRGADTSGLKADLIERLQELVDKNGAAKEEKLKPPSSAAKSKPKSAKKPPKSASKAAAEEEDDKEAATEEPAAPPKSAAKPPKSAAKATPTKDSSKTPAKAKTPARTSPSPARSATKAASPAPAPTPAAPPAKFHYEFGGPIGAVGVMLGLPIVIYGLFFACGGLSDEWCLASPAQLPMLREKWAQVPPLQDWWTHEAALVFVGWFVFQALLERCLPGEVAEGVVLSNGQRLKYRLNGHLAFWVSLLLMGHGCPKFDPNTGAFLGFGAFPLAWLYDQYLPLATAAIAFSAVLSLYLYATSFARNALLAEGGNSGNPVYDFFIGRELNPRVGSFDLKYFCELRPGLIGWAVLNLGMAAKQRELNGAVSASMWLVNAFQGVYVWDAVYQERAILTTMDITTDGFGFMLAFGDLAWVPFTYTLQARYLVTHDAGLSPLALAAIAALNCLGYWVFRGANGQKVIIDLYKRDAFRRDPTSPEVRHLKWMPTQRGTKLLTSGWWGYARKINYTGDWCMGLSWCLLTGFNSIVTYFYAIYFGVLLIHRAMRDDEMCAKKYGDDWKTYKAKVPSTFIPGIPI